MDGSQVVIINRLQPQSFQTLHLLPVVDYIAEAVELPSLLQLVLCTADSTCHACAETTMGINRYNHLKIEILNHKSQLPYLGIEDANDRLHLLFARHIAVVHHDGIFRLTQR